MPDKQCFVIAPIGDAESEIRNRSDEILKYVITPAVEPLGYEAIRADHISEPGIITSQVIQHVVDDPLVVADLTGRNPNVFYELAIRHMLRKPFVQLIKKGEQIPFDVAGTRTISIDHSDLDSVEEAKKEIVAQIGALERNSSTVQTPISVSLDLQSLRQSENPEQRSLADVLSVVSEMRTSITGLEKRLDRPETLLPLSHLRAALSHHRGDRPFITRKTLFELETLLQDLDDFYHKRDPDSRDVIARRVAYLRHYLRQLVVDTER